MQDKDFEETIDSIFIPGNVPSSKNSKTWTGKHLIWSKMAQKYVKNTEKYWIEYRDTFLIEFNNYSDIRIVGFYFKRNSRHKWDFHNAVQTITDLMVRYNWIKDDSSNIILPIPLKIDDYYWEYNKETPGVIIKIIKDGKYK